MRKRRLGIAAAALAAALVGGELALRAAGFSAPAWTRPDADLGWTLRPELREVNLHGLRDRERLRAKPADVYRIAVLGDDYSEARGVPIAQTWWARLEQALNACDARPGRRVEVLNFAIGGFGTAQQYVQLQSDVLRYQPDLVLLQFNGADDVRNNSFALEPQKARPFFMLDANGALVIDDAFATAPGFRARATFAQEALRKASDKLRLVQLAQSLGELRAVSPAHAAGTDRASDNALWDEAWRITEALIGASHAHAARNGTRFALLAAPHPEERLHPVARRLGIPLFEAAQGHEATAQAVARRLCAGSG